MSDGNNFAREYSCKQISDACLHAEMAQATSSENKMYFEFSWQEVELAGGDGVCLL